MDKLKLTLSEDNTKITDITHESALFLGFSIFRKAYKRYRNVTIAPIEKSLAGSKSAVSAQKQTRQHYTQIDDPRAPPRSLYRSAASVKLSVGIDQERILKRWVINGTITHTNHYPKELPAYSILPIQDIITYYNQRMLGLAQYYYKILTQK